jgi:hypothetical protein
VRTLTRGCKLGRWAAIGASLLAAAVLAVAAPAAADPEAAADDLDVPAEASPVHESVQQFLYRRRYVAVTLVSAREAIFAHNKAITAAEKAVVHRHWRVALKLLHMRDAAENVGDAAGVKRAEAALDLAGKRLVDRLAKLNADAPPRS